MNENKRPLIIVVLIWSLLVAVLCTAPAATAFAAPRQVVTDIYHMHLGNAQDGGGCYGQERYHECQGDEEHGGACYEDEAHTHKESCYQEKQCVLYNTVGTAKGTKTDTCPRHGTREFTIAEGTSRHTDCGLGEVDNTFVFCPDCGVYSPEIHRYSAVICGLEEGKYTKICGKEDGSTLEGYELNCGLEGVCGRLIVTNETEVQQETAMLHVQIEDLTGGKLLLSDEPYIWYDRDGNVLGSGEYLEVEENGDYQAEVHLENRDVEESGLRSMISVDNIRGAGETSPEPVESEKPKPSAEPSERPSASATPSAAPSTTPSETPEASAIPEATKEPEATAKPSTEPDTEEDDSDFIEPIVPTASPTASPIAKIADDGVDRSGGEKNEENQWKAIEGWASSRQSEIDGAALPTASPSEKKEDMLTRSEQTVTLPETLEDIVIEVQPIKRRQSFWERPVVKMVTVTLGTLLLLAGIFLILFCLRRSVRLYNDNGEGRWLYLGRLWVHTEEEGYVVMIPEKLVEKAYTNRYEIRPGLFLAGRSEEELLVYGETKRIAVPLSREMIVML